MKSKIIAIGLVFSILCCSIRLEANTSSYDSYQQAMNSSSDYESSDKTYKIAITCSVIVGVVLALWVNSKIIKKAKKDKQIVDQLFSIFDRAVTAMNEQEEEVALRNFKEYVSEYEKLNAKKLKSLKVEEKLEESKKMIDILEKK
jgi:hypothetical protein